jgi:FkbM family methyltransferase
MDGLTYTNTLFFEETLNWKGILIEPTIGQFQRLVVNRPNCENFNYAISKNDGFVEFLGDGAIGGMTHTMNDRHRYGWKLEEQFSSYQVPSVPISKLLKNVERVDLFSIDVEGGEFEVLDTFDWSIPVYLILIEMSNEDPAGYDAGAVAKNEKCRDLMRSKGFVFKETVGCNEVWINIKNKKSTNEN